MFLFRKSKSKSNQKCQECGEWYNYEDFRFIWCKPCHINNFKKFTNWTSKNEKIDSLIQEMQLKSTYDNDIIFEWVPYNQFNDIKEIGDDGLDKVHSAIWKDGPLKHDFYNDEYTRKQNQRVSLKCLYG